MNIAYLGKKNV